MIVSSLSQPVPNSTSNKAKDSSRGMGYAFGSVGKTDVVFERLGASY